MVTRMEGARDVGEAHNGDTRAAGAAEGWVDVAQVRVALVRRPGVDVGPVGLVGVRCVVGRRGVGDVVFEGAVDFEVAYVGCWCWRESAVAARVVVWGLGLGWLWIRVQQALTGPMGLIHGDDVVVLSLVHCAMSDDLDGDVESR